MGAREAFWEVKWCKLRAKLWNNEWKSLMSGNSVGLLFSCSVISEPLWPHGLQHPSLPCPSLSPRVCSDLRPLTHWCLPTISSSVTPFFSCLQSFPASESFPMTQVFESGGQSIGALASVLPMNIQGWFPLGLTGLISLLFSRDSQESSAEPQFESVSSSALSLLYGPTLTFVRDYRKDHSFGCTDLGLESVG